MSAFEIFLLPNSGICINLKNPTAVRHYKSVWNVLTALGFLKFTSTNEVNPSSDILFLNLQVEYVSVFPFPAGTGGRTMFVGGECRE